MEKFKAKIIDPIGLHARPAAIVSKTASRFKSDIFISGKDKEANLKSIMNVMALGIKKGDEFEIKANGPDAAEALMAIKQVMLDEKMI
ncbi:phosphocarrier protein [Mycoplasma testudineum]|uniref:Phosphocarrier protein HPr n=1 Tax=Mycoplasma testudineum TaxID=244584 RepID=A0A4V3C2P3_9MOLU|nr:HPr family phosphocarrier protein [Mycoplasma testudineum]OYD26523.1 phosphocarrier protein HPr [Mycoplasma testudineum]TDO19139.1 phosphocarrier protein [Mycoplasma testudineum]